MSKKYLNNEEFLAIVGEIIIDKRFSVMSQDSYNETAVSNTIRQTGRVQELCQAAINMATIGYGNKKYGAYKFGDQVCDILALMNACNVKTHLEKDAKLKEEELTPQRLCRAFRNQIRAYILETKLETYQFRKYSDHNPRFFHLMFRGAEYLDDLNPEECHYMLSVYNNMDASLNTNISDRVTRVFQAKGYLARRVNV